MAIVRELLIRLGFQTDKRAINQTNQAITGFRTRFAFVAAAATYAFSRIATFFSDIAKATLNSNDLAKSLGISLRELTQIQGAAQKIGRLDFQETSQALGKVQQLLRNFRAGTDDELARIAEAFNFQIDVNAGPVQAFNQILEGLANISNVAERINIAERIFGNGLGAKFAELAGNLNEFKEAMPDFEQVGKDAEGSLQAFKDYQDAINGLTTAWTNLTLKLSQTVVPVLTGLANLLAGISDVYLGLFKWDKSTLQSGIKSISSVLDPLINKSGINGAIDYVFNPAVYSPNSLRQDMPQVTLNSEVNVTLPQGTPEETARYISEEANAAFQAKFQEYMQQIQNNNPMVE